MTFAAFWLPGSTNNFAMAERSLGPDTLLQYPQLTRAQVDACCAQLIDAAASARSISVADRIAAVAAAAGRLMDPAGSLYRQATQLIPMATGYSPEMTRYVLEHISRDWSRQALETLVASEFGSAAPLDGLAPATPGRRSTAFGPRLAAHIFSGNVPGVALNSLIRALLVKAPSFGKTASDEPILAVLFARALHQVEPRLAATMAITYWPGGSPDAESALFEAADTIIVYGGADTVDSVRRRTGSDTRLLVHGPKLSLGLVNARSLNHSQLRDTASDAALAAALFDQQGCVSPHAVYLLGSVEQTHHFARLTAEALAALEPQLPRGRITAAEAAAIQEARARAEFRAIAGAQVAVHAGERAGYTVVGDSDPAFEASCLNRFLYVRPLHRIDQLPELLSGFGPFLQSVATAGFTDHELEEAAALLGPLGVVRLTTFSALPWPPPHWHHDGRGPLQELIRWLDLET